MDIHIGDTLQLKKPHPCGADRFLVMRVGMDFKLKCLRCGHEIFAPRRKIEKNIKQIFPVGKDEPNV